MRPNHRDIQSQQKICVFFSMSFPVVSRKFPTALPEPGLFSVIRFLFFLELFSESLLNPGLLVQQLFGLHRIIADSYLPVHEHVYLIFIVGEIP